MASFHFKNAHFSYPLHSTHNLKKFSLNCIPQILYTESLDKGLIFPVKSVSLRLNA